MRQFVHRLTHSVLGKVLTLTAVLVSLSVAAGMATTAVVGDRLYTKARNQAADSYALRLQQELDTQRQIAEQLAVAIAANPDVQKAFAERDRARLSTLLQPGFDTLKSDYGMAQMQFHTPPATSFLRLHLPKKFGDDLSAFRFTVVEANQQHHIVAGVEGGVAGLGVRAVVPMTYRGRHTGTLEFGTSLGKAFVERITKDFSAQTALYVPTKDGKGLEASASTLAKGLSVDTAVLASANKGTQRITDAVIDGRAHLVLYQPLRDYRGATVGVIVMAKDATDLAAARAAAKQLGMLSGAGVLLLGLVLGTAISMRISRSLTASVRQVSAVLAKVVDGDFTTRAPLTGDLAVREMAERMNQALASTSGALRAMANSSARVTSSMTDLHQAGQAMTIAAGQAQSQAQAVSEAATQVTQSVQQAAAGSEQMSASIREIASHTSEAASVGGRAMERAEETNAQVGRLGDSSAQIGDVLQLISSIAGQTNLLALNATIEAARAGEMGKGFAVVAGEVKTLAQQTATATEDITGRVEAIQTEAAAAAAAIEVIGSVIEQVNGYQTTIASAVEEQNVTTSDISHSVSAAAAGVQDIAGNVAQLVEATQATSRASEDALRAADVAAAESAQMHDLVARFRLQ